jgi:hypothetical protein
MADGDSSGRSRSRSRSPQEQTVLLAQIFIIEIDPATKFIVGYLPWDGTEPGENDMLIVHDVKVSDNTYDAYTHISADVHNRLNRLEKYKSYHRTKSPERSFEHLRGQYPNGNCFSYLSGNLEGHGRAHDLYGKHVVYGRTEPLQGEFLRNLMTKTQRHTWRRDDFKIYASNELKDGRPVSCWYLVNGHDVWDENSDYIKEVNVSDIPSSPSDTAKPYYVLHDFTVNNIYSYCLRREIVGNNPFRRKTGRGQKAGKSRRKLKLRFKRKTIKRIFKKR